MWKTLRDFIFSRVFRAEQQQIRQLSHELAGLQHQYQTLRVQHQRLEDMLTNRNVTATKAQTLYITEHALSRYRSRIGFKGTDEELRKMIYKLTIRHLATMDCLPDGEYTINEKAAVRVKDNTVCTIIPAKKNKRNSR